MSNLAVERLPALRSHLDSFDASTIELGLRVEYACYGDHSRASP